MAGVTAAQRDALILAEREARNKVRDQVSSYATHLWTGLGDWRDEDVARFVSQVVPRVQAGQNMTARMTDTFLNTLTGKQSAGMVGLDGLRGGVSLEEVYRRPALTMRAELAAGKSFPEAQAAAVTRLQSLVASDMQLANTRQAHHNLAGVGRSSTRSSSGRRRLVGRGETQFYRRTLVGPKNCALCMIASTQRYRVGDLMPIHPGCNCGIDPLTAAEAAAGQVIDPAFLEQIHEEVGRAFGQSDRAGRAIDYRKLVAVQQHGEYGPVLSWSRHGFTGPAQLPPGVAREVVEVTAKETAAEVAQSELVQMIADDDLAAWSDDDLLDTLDYAKDQSDRTAEMLLENEWQRRRAIEAGGAQTFTRAQMRELYAQHIEDQYRRAEEACYYLVNKEGQAKGIDPRSLFSGNLNTGWKYATEELKRWWSEPGNTRLTFAAFQGDQNALYLATKGGIL